jgi:hypothetical protein
MVDMRTLQECQILLVDGSASTSYSSIADVISITNANMELPPKTCIFTILDTMKALHNLNVRIPRIHR